MTTHLRTTSLAAEKEAPGEWTSGAIAGDSRDYITTKYLKIVADVTHVEPAIVAHIAACSPSRILALLARVEQLEAGLREACDLAEQEAEEDGDIMRMRTRIAALRALAAPGEAGKK